MPRYDYKCNKCPVITEWEHPMSWDLAAVECPACGDGFLSKKYSATPVQFKGSGFYSTDNS